VNRPVTWPADWPTRPLAVVAGPTRHRHRHAIPTGRRVLDLALWAGWAAIALVAGAGLGAGIFLNLI
jgi:predicted nicotinamide N-methyase